MGSISLINIIEALKLENYKPDKIREELEKIICFLKTSMSSSRGADGQAG
jgi:hypothetical protein